MMNDYFSYLELPPLPIELHKEAHDIVLTGEDLFHRNDPNYQVFDASDAIKDFVRPLFPEFHKFNIRVQVIRNEPGIHVDHNRDYAHNFLIDLGGDNVVTSFFENSTNKLIASHVIEKHRWHRLNVTQKHNVTNITGNRIAITCHHPWQ